MVIAGIIMPPPTGDGDITFSGCPSGRPSVNSLCDTISFYLVERFLWNLPQMFIMLKGRTEMAVKVRGQRSRSSAISISKHCEGAIFWVVEGFQRNLLYKCSSWPCYGKNWKCYQGLGSKSKPVSFKVLQLFRLSLSYCKVYKCVYAMWRRRTFRRCF